MKWTDPRHVAADLKDWVSLKEPGDEVTGALVTAEPVKPDPESQYPDAQRIKYTLLVLSASGTWLKKSVTLGAFARLRQDDPKAAPRRVADAMGEAGFGAYVRIMRYGKKSNETCYTVLPVSVPVGAADSLKESLDMISADAELEAETPPDLPPGVE
jgi:hypothetical protein